MAEAKDDALEGRDGLTRRDVIKKAGLGAFTVTMFGGLAEKAFPFYGPLKYPHKQLAGNLRILQWIHFVPGYDQWFDNTWIKQWGEKNDVQVSVDHINNAELFARGSAEVAAQSGHDLFQFLSPPSSFQKQVIPLTDIVQEVTKKLGKMTDVAYKSTYNPRTKQYFGFADNYVPDPMHYRRSLWFNAGIGPKTWEDVRKAAPILKKAGHPVGLGMSNEIDSNMFLFALMYCYGGFIQNRAGQVTLNSKGTVEALKVMRDIFQNGMSDEVFAWTAASNNQAFLAGRLSAAMNAISIARTAEKTNPTIADDTWLAPIPRGPVMRMGNEHVMGIYVIWKFAQNKANAKRFLVDQQLAYRQHFVNSEFYNFPAWTGAVKGGFATMRKMAAADTHKPRGKYTILTTIAEKYTANVGFPGFSNAGIDEVFNKYLIPQMFAQVAQGKSTPEAAARSFAGQVRGIFAKWRGQGLL
jgi:multiple sugar transport system substrate-binding protein